MTYLLNKNQVNFYLVSEKDENQRLDNLLMRLLKGVPKTHIYRIIRSGEIRINKKRSQVNTKVSIGDILRIPPISIKDEDTQSIVNIPKSSFPIIYEDDYYLVINKPDGIACHGGSGVSFGVIEQLRNFYPLAKFLELAHRLDRETSGILILAKKRQALVKLQELIKNGQIEKHYFALTNGVWKDRLRNVKAPLLKYLNKDGERRVCVDQNNGQFAHTIFKAIGIYDNYTLVDANLKTGRTHQIRVHLQHIGYHILGDTKYGNFEQNKELSKTGLKRMFLHAYNIKFIHPVTNITLELTVPIPTNLQTFLDNLTKQSI